MYGAYFFNNSYIFIYYLSSIIKVKEYSPADSVLSWQNFQ